MNWLLIAVCLVDRLRLKVVGIGEFHLVQYVLAIWSRIDEMAAVTGLIVRMLRNMDDVRYRLFVTSSSSKWILKSSWICSVKYTSVLLYVVWLERKYECNSNSQPSKMKESWKRVALAYLYADTSLVIRVAVSGVETKMDVIFECWVRQSDGMGQKKRDQI